MATEGLKAETFQLDSASTVMEMDERQQQGIANASAADGEDEIRPQLHRGLKAMPFIIGNETFERLGTIGTLSNLTVYLTTVFNMKTVNAATLINLFNGTSNMSPLLGAYLSDTYLGRFNTLCFASVSSLLVELQTSVFLLCASSNSS
ncbi:hypothetical protein SAY87_018585 [Trapa incisa]|uniref:Nitrate transporter n=1 Tax=Trapa incisa TaxID=236973 RepID=A0AAN7QX61_9MYRT|nr:hypothetical protein SAY87_018585 [Trapa incisa]